MVVLSDKEKTIGKGFIADLFYSGGVITESLRKPYSYNNCFNGLENEAKNIAREIIYHEFAFVFLDEIFNIIDGIKFIPAPRKPCGTFVSRPKEVLAAYLASFCAERKIYWDDVTAKKSASEIEKYKKTIFGGALWDYKCFVSQQIEEQN